MKKLFLRSMSLTILALAWWEATSEAFCSNVTPSCLATCGRTRTSRMKLSKSQRQEAFNTQAALVSRYVSHCHATHKRRSPPSNYGREDLCAQSSCIPLAEAEVLWAPAFAMLGKGEQCQKCMRQINLPLVHSRWEKSLV